MYDILTSLFSFLYDVPPGAAESITAGMCLVVTVVLCKHEYEMYIKVNVLVYTANLVSRLPPVQYIYIALFPGSPHAITYCA